MTATVDRSLVVHQAVGPIALQLAGDEARLAVLKDVIAKGCSDEELEVFALVCQRTKLDPFAKQIYAIKRRAQENGQWVERLTIQTSIDGFRLIAQRSREYQGQIGPQWCREDGVWKDVWLTDDLPAAARVGILRKGFREPLWGTAVWKRAAQWLKQNNQTVLAPFWKRMPAEMLAITAERNAIRRAFPQDTYGLELATADEIEADHDAALANAAKYDEIMAQQYPDEVITRANGNRVNTASGEVIEEGSFTEPEAAEENPQVAKRAQLSELLRESKKRGLTGEAPLGHSTSEDPLDVAIAYWVRRIENFDLDQQSARASGQGAF